MQSEQRGELSNEAFEAFKEAANEEYGLELTGEEIREMGSRLLRLFALLRGVNVCAL